jgi:hypothetical protein
LGVRPKAMGVDQLLIQPEKLNSLAGEVRT